VTHSCSASSARPISRRGTRGSLIRRPPRSQAIRSPGRRTLPWRGWLITERPSVRELALRWAIVPRELGASAGTIGLFRFSQIGRRAEIGAAIGRAHWSRGLATRAGRIVLDYAFANLALEAVEAVVLPENTRTLRVLEKLGFARRFRPCPAERYVGGRPDSRLFVLRAADWSPPRSRRSVGRRHSGGA
jgi:RimJ/RimL family protein N-acetyltransferase